MVPSVRICQDLEYILNGTLNAKLNRLYQCQSNISFITLLEHCLRHTQGQSVVLRHTRVAGQFNESGQSYLCTNSHDLTIQILICSINVCGLNSKLKYNVLQDYMQQFDFLKGVHRELDLNT